MATNYGSDEDFDDDLLEPQVILDADEYQNMSDDEDNQSSSSLLEVQIDDRSALNVEAQRSFIDLSRQTYSQ